MAETVERRVFRFLLRTDQEVVKYSEIFRALKAPSVAAQTKVITAIESLIKRGYLTRCSRRSVGLAPEFEKGIQFSVQETVEYQPKFAMPTSDRGKVLKSLSLIGGYATASAVAKVSKLSKSAAAKILRELEAQGAVYSISAPGLRYTLTAAQKPVLDELSPKWVELSIGGVGGATAEDVISLLTSRGYMVSLSATDEKGRNIDVVVDKAKVVELVVLETVTETKKAKKAKKTAKISAAKRKKGGGGGTAIPGRKINFRDPDEKEEFTKAVADFVRKAGGPVTSTEINQEVGGSANQIRQVLMPFVEGGLISCTGKARATRYEWNTQ